MTQTRQKLVNRALFHLGAAPTGQTPDPEDYQTVDNTVETVMSDLATRNVWQWGDPDAIDNDAFEHLAICLAVPNRRLGGDLTEQDRLLAEGRLRQLNVPALSGQPQPAEYY